MAAFCSTPSGTPATVAVALGHAGSRESLCDTRCKQKVPPALVECAQAATFFIADRSPEVMPYNVGDDQRTATAAQAPSDAVCLSRSTG